MNENGHLEQFQLPIDTKDKEEVLKQSKKECSLKAMSPETKSTTSSAPSSDNTTSSSPSQDKEQKEAGESPGSPVEPQVVMVNGKVSSSNNDLEGLNVDGIVNRYQTEDSEDNDMSSHCHSQPPQDKQDALAHNVCTRQQDELNLLRLKNGSPLNRSAITDSLDRFFEIQPQQSQEDEDVKAGNNNSRESREPQVSSCLLYTSDAADE